MCVSLMNVLAEAVKIIDCIKSQQSRVHLFDVIKRMMYLMSLPHGVGWLFEEEQRELFSERNKLHLSGGINFS